MRLSFRLPAMAVLSCLASSAALGGRARAAAPAPPPPLSTSLTGEARTSYESGRLLLEVHKYDDAAIKYRAAYDASHDARLLWNVALCEKELHHYARASALVGRFLHEASSLLGPEQLAQAQAAQAALAQLFSLVTVSVQPAGARITLDGEGVGLAPLASPLAVDLGKHVVRVQREGYRPAEQSIDVTGPHAADVVLSLSPVPQAASLANRPSDDRATITVDRATVAHGAWEGPMSAGTHQLEVTADGKRPFRMDLTLGAGEHRSLDVTLESKPAVWPWWVGGGALIVAGAVIGGYFLFRPSDTTGAFPTTDFGRVMLSSPRSAHR